jgi:hypothetical protein
MATTGALFPTVAVSVDRAGNGAWTNPGNVVSDNTTDATVTVPSDYLVTSGYGFAIPASATITGVTVRVQASETGSGGSAYTPQLHSGTTPTLIGSAKTSTVVSGTTKVISTNGGSSDLWGATLTPAIVNDSGFGVSIWSADTSNANVLAVDYVTVEVTYSDLPPLPVDQPNPTVRRHAGLFEVAQVLLLTAMASPAVDTVFRDPLVTRFAPRAAQQPHVLPNLAIRQTPLTHSGSGESTLPLLTASGLSGAEITPLRPVDQSNPVVARYVQQPSHARPAPAPLGSFAGEGAATLPLLTASGDATGGAVATPPRIRPVDMSSPVRVRRVQQSTHHRPTPDAGPPAPEPSEDAPFRQSEWFTPILDGGLDPSQDWDSVALFPAAPFSQKEWPNPVRRKAPPQLVKIGGVLSPAVSLGHTGSGAPTLPLLTSEGAGKKVRAGTGTPTLPLLTSSGAGKKAKSGSGAATIPLLTASGSGEPDNNAHNWFRRTLFDSGVGDRVQNWADRQRDKGVADLAGEASASVTATGALSNAVSLAGDAVVSFSASLTPLVARAQPIWFPRLTDTHQTWAEWTYESSGVVSLQGSATGGATATGSLVPDEDGVIDGSGYLRVQADLGGTAAGGAVATGELTGSAILAGGAVAGSSATGALTEIGKPLDGAASVSVTGAAALAVTKTLAGDASVSVEAEAEIADVSVELAGDSAFSFAATGALTVFPSLTGAAVASVEASGTLTHALALEGAAAVRVSATGTLVDPFGGNTGKRTAYLPYVYRMVTIEIPNRKVDA